MGKGLTRDAAKLKALASLTPFATSPNAKGRGGSR